MFFPSFLRILVIWLWIGSATRNLKANLYSVFSKVNWLPDWLGNSAGVGNGVAALKLSKDEIDRIDLETLQH